MDVSLATPEKIFFSGPSNDVLLNAERGQLNLLDRHTNLISLVKPGPVVIKTAQGDKRYEVSEGILKVESNQLSILCSQVKPLPL